MIRHLNFRKLMSAWFYQTLCGNVSFGLHLFLFHNNKHPEHPPMRNPKMIALFCMRKFSNYILRTTIFTIKSLTSKQNPYDLTKLVPQSDLNQTKLMINVSLYLS